jgi:Concanavalin A-like lectin/glucanases superfamily
MSTIKTQGALEWWLREAAAFATVAAIVLGIAVCPHFSSARADAGQGLVVALGFNESAGATTYDHSPARSSATVVGATRIAGQTGFGGALSFDGTDDAVSVGPLEGANLHEPITIEAWVNPRAVQDGSPASTLPLNTWSHVATASDGSVVRVYVNGVERSRTAAPTDALWAPVHVGSGKVTSGSFAGLVDDVRVYNRALSVSEIRSDMATPLP